VLAKEVRTLDLVVHLRDARLDDGSIFAWDWEPKVDLRGCYRFQTLSDDSFAVPMPEDELHRNFTTQWINDVRRG
jgi:hypothetical protein